jgi:hypothetical protein
MRTALVIIALLELILPIGGICAVAEPPHSSVAGLRTGRNEYAVAGSAIRVTVTPFSRRMIWSGLGAKCSADSAVCVGGPTPYSNIGPLVQVYRPCVVVFQYMDPCVTASEQLELSIAEPGLYTIEVDDEFDRDCKGRRLFVVAGRDTLETLQW